MATQKVDEGELVRLLQDEAMQLPDMGLVVSGMAGRFPKSDTVSEFEENLLRGTDMINDKDESRFSCGLWNLPPRAGRLNDLTKFDCEFFGFSTEQANQIDFQMRILYEVVYESILDAGINPSTLRGSKTGVFFGLHCNEFENAMADDPNYKSNGYNAQFAVKVAQYFDFRGITITFDAACASGFVGLHNAIEALEHGLVDQAIVCSSNIPIHPTGSFIFLQMQMLSPTGYSRFLDSRADGYVKSEACVSILIQRKHLALRNYASFMATMTSVDGYKPEGITFPSDKSQERLIRSTKQLAKISTNHIEYLEAHGTGTPAGDPQEAQAISSVYCPLSTGWRDNDGNDDASEERRVIGPLLVGSVKTNMGHSEAASGLCALVKVALMLENELIYRGLHYEQPNSNIDSLMDGRLQFVDQTTDLRAKIVPISCYGFGGSNVHVILRANERPVIEFGETDAVAGEPPRLITMFGRSKEALNLFFDRMLDTNGRNTRNCLTDDFLLLLDSLNSVPIDRLMNYRGFMIVDRVNKLELSRSIRRCELSQVKDDIAFRDSGRQRHFQDCQARKCNLILPGLNSQWAGSASGLQNYKPFWSTIERLQVSLEPFGLDLTDLLCNQSTESLSTAAGTFVAIIAYELALINLVKQQLKIEVAGIVGHSLGEISSAYAAGLFDEREAIMVAYHIGACLDANKHLVAGKMIAISNLAAKDAPSLLRESLVSFDKQTSANSLQIACVNGQGSVSVSGRREDVDRFCAFAKAKGYAVKDLETCGMALHNEYLMAGELKQKLKDALTPVLMPLTNYDRTGSSWISCTSLGHDNDVTMRPQANAEYFAECICSLVDFNRALDKLTDDTITLELGPSAQFTLHIMEKLSDNNAKKEKFHHVSLMQISTKPEQQLLTLIAGLGQLYQAGALIQLNKLHRAAGHLPVRRQTPSLGSLFAWDHKHSLFVPRYPIQFSKSSAKSEMPVDIVQDRDKYFAGHCIEGRILFPATGYLFLIWRVFSFTKRRIFDACFHEVESELVPVEFHNVRLMRAIILGNRQAQIYIHLEEGTGRFEIKEGGSVVVEGYARTPVESPHGLLYEDVRERIKGEELKLEMSADDVYKQFRVSGYDYGETFRNIEAASLDGRYCRVNYNGHFVALTDSILQSIFLAISQYAPSGGLFLPTRFEYVRFQPEMILAKIRASNMKFDLSDSSLNTLAKREIMSKIMQREGLDNGNLGNSQDNDINDDDSEKQAESAADSETKEEKIPCVFETYCDPVTGIIITDGIEMRGIKASPAPRRSDPNEVLLESYQFVADIEDPVADERLTRFEQVTSTYVRHCNSLALDLLRRFGSELARVADGLSQANGDCKPLISGHDAAQQYKETRLSSKYSATDRGEHEYDIKKNGDLMLLSVIDQLAGGASDVVKQDLSETIKFVREIVQKNRTYLMRDLIPNTLLSERIMRPIMELVLENCCAANKQRKLRLLEINPDDGLVKDPLQHLVSQVAPTCSLEYSLAHPDASRLTKQLATAGNNSQSTATGVKTYVLKSASDLGATLFGQAAGGQQLGNQDLIVYKDISCYSLPKQVIEQNGLGPVMSSLNEAVRVGGFVMVLMRNKLTLAERILLSLSEPELVGLSKRDLEQMTSNKRQDGKVSPAIDKIRHIDSILMSRCKLMQIEAELKNNMICVSQKSDANGCIAMLFRRTAKFDTRQQQTTRSVDRVLLKIQHDDAKSISSWLEELKSHFKTPAQSSESSGDNNKDSADDEQTETQRAGEQVWLCAVMTKRAPVSGVVGMMQALSKELGLERLRCFFDCHTFRDWDKEVSVQDIERSAKFQQALHRDLIWNCVDQEGNFGAYRHFTINEYMSYEQCLCGKSDENTELQNGGEMVATGGAYVNTAQRGDLSSFSWFEAPHKYLCGEQAQNVCRVAYSALNFRDIMLATGRLPMDAVPMKFAMSDCLLGLEFSGWDLRGRRVMGMVPGRGIATHVHCPPDSSVLVEIPDSMSLEDAATIPIVYGTAIMAMIYRGRARCGESILIHAGSGGVGQAALRMAAYLGLEVFTTVGTDEKRKFLLEEFSHVLTNERIFSSRDCTFEAEIMRATGGRGVDLVLNSLADDKLQASIRCLADGGRFLEIGKYDLSMDSRLELLQLDTNKTFHGILLDKMFDSDDDPDAQVAFKAQMQGIQRTLQRGIDEGFVRPIKYQVFKRTEVEQAFRFMAGGKHIGKILLEIEPSSTERQPAPSADCLPPPIAVPRFQLSPVKSYIVTGGLGGFGLELTKWLVSQGARHLLLTSRKGVKTGYQRATLERLESTSGASIRVVTEQEADTTLQSGVNRLGELAVASAPCGQVGGIFHLAMVLKDCLIENMSAEDFELVCKPKLATGMHLDAWSRQKLEHKLDYFVAFSSVTSGKGNAGQANYAYANSCLERLCERRRAAGEHGLAIQWGAIGDVGVAYENLGGNNVVIGGTIPQRMPSCLATLGKLLCSPFAVCLSVLPVSRGSDGAGDKGDLVAAIMHVLGIKDPSKVSDQATLGELGLDSLMAVEIRQYIEREYDMTLNMQEIRSLTIAKIREISENGKPSASEQKQHSKQVASSLPGQEMKEAQSYGTAATGASAGTDDKLKTDGRSDTQKLSPMKAANQAIEAMLDRSMVASFVPQLELPQADFRRLNYKQYQQNGCCTKTMNSKRPIFFMPPIHGEFDRLEKVAAHVERPCIGLNWTRRLGRATSVAEAVEVYLDLLIRADWRSEFYLDASGAANPNSDNIEGDDIRVVDLVGYSYGATIAFELMLSLHRRQQRAARRLANGLADNLTGGLRAGNLVLLDGSPRQIELGSQLLDGLTRRRPLKLSEKVDELLMLYILSHTRKMNIDYVPLQRQLARKDLEQKVKFASERLARILGFADSNASNGSGTVQVKAADRRDLDEDLDSGQTRLAHAMEAFLRRYELINNYKANSSLPADCTLIRAEKLYLSSGGATKADNKFNNEDLDLSSVVKGQVKLFVMSGDHETFLDLNQREIGDIITKNCSRSSTS